LQGKGGRGPGTSVTPLHNKAVRSASWTHVSTSRIGSVAKQRPYRVNMPNPNYETLTALHHRVDCEVQHRRLVQLLL
jgi:hypothetical protein